MRARWMIMLWGLAACGSGDSDPEWGSEVSAAIQDVDASLQGSAAKADTAAAACGKLKDALMRETRNELLRQECLKIVAVIEAELESGRGDGDKALAQARSRWAEVRDKLKGVRPAPKNAGSAAQGLRDAVAAVDRALDAGDNRAARSELGGVRRALGAVGESAPPPVRSAVGELMGELDSLDSGLFDASGLAAAKGQWQSIRSRLLRLVD